MKIKPRNKDEAARVVQSAFRGRQGRRHVSLRRVAALMSGKTYTDSDAGQHGQSAPLAGPQLDPCASSGSAWWLWATCTHEGSSRATGRAATASGCSSEPPASKVAESTGF